VLQEQGFAQPFGDVWGQPGEEGRLGRSIRRSSSFPVQTQGSPTGSIGDKRGAHLISQGQWRQDLPVALAAAQLALGLFAEHSNRQVILEQVEKFVEVIL